MGGSRLAKINHQGTHTASDTTTQRKGLVGGNKNLSQSLLNRSRALEPKVATSTLSLQFCYDGPSELGPPQQNFSTIVMKGK